MAAGIGSPTARGGGWAQLRPVVGPLASELRFCRARAGQCHPEAWSHSPAARELWRQGVCGVPGARRSGLGSLRRAGAQGSMMVGVSEGSAVTQVLVRDAQCGYPHGRADGASGDPSRAWASGPWREPQSGEATDMGWVHPRKDFPFTQGWRSGPRELRKSPPQPLFSLLWHSAASPPLGRSTPNSPLPGASCC